MKKYALFIVFLMSCLFAVQCFYLNKSSSDIRFDRHDDVCRYYIYGKGVSAIEFCVPLGIADPEKVVNDLLHDLQNPDFAKLKSYNEQRTKDIKIEKMFSGYKENVAKQIDGAEQ